MSTIINVQDLGSEDSVRYASAEDQTVGEFIEEILGHDLASIQFSVNGQNVDVDDAFEAGDTLVISQKKYASGLPSTIISVQNLGEDGTTRYGVGEADTIADFIEDILGHDLTSVQVTLNGEKVEDFDDLFDAGDTLVISQKKYASGTGIAV